MSAYLALEKKFREMWALGCAQALMHWDSATMMPPSETKIPAQ